MSPSDSLLGVRSNHLGSERDGRELRIGSLAQYIKLATKKIRM
jgi:hypothetical protein